MRRRLRAARVHLDARDLDADRRPRPGRLRAARLPDQQAPAARGDQRVPARPQAQRSPRHSVCIECKRRGNVCVMVATARRASARSPTPAAARSARAYDRGCYGCFGPMETPNTASLAARSSRSARAPSDRAARLPHVQRQRAAPFRGSGEPGAMSDECAGRSRSTTSPASRARARSPLVLRRRARSTTVELAHLRAAALLRGAPARPRFSRGARHHRAHLRHLPGRLPDERVPGDGGRARRRGRRRAARAAAPALLRRVDREPRAARLHAARARLPRLPDALDAWPSTTPSAVKRGAAHQEGRQRDRRAARRPRDPPDQRPRRRLLPRARRARARRACCPSCARARDAAARRVDWVAGFDVPRRSSATTSSSRCGTRASTR